MMSSRFLNKILSLLAAFVFSFVHATDVLDEAKLPKMPTILTKNLVISKATLQEYDAIVQTCARGGQIAKNDYNFNGITPFGYFLIQDHSRKTVGGMHYGVDSEEADGQVLVVTHQSPDILKEFQGRGYGSEAVQALIKNIFDPLIGKKVPYFSIEEDAFVEGVFSHVFSEVEWMSGENHPALSMCLKAGFGLKQISGRNLSTDCALVTYPKDVHAFQDSSIAALMAASKTVYGAYQKFQKGEQSDDDDTDSADTATYLNKDQLAGVRRNFRLVMTQERNIPTIVYLSKLLAEHLSNSEIEAKNHQSFCRKKIRELQDLDKSKTYATWSVDKVARFEQDYSAYFPN